MLPLPELLHAEDGAVSFMSLAVLLIFALSLLFLRPIPEKETTFHDSLGGEILVERL